MTQIYQRKNVDINSFTEVTEKAEALKIKKNDSERNVSF